MERKQKTTKNGKMTIEKLARMSQNEFTAIRSDTSELKDGLRNIKEDIGILRRDMEAGFEGVSHGMKAIMKKLNAIQADVIEIHDLRSRVERLEKKVGLQK